MDRCRRPRYLFRPDVGAVRARPRPVESAGRVQLGEQHLVQLVENPGPLPPVKAPPAGLSGAEPKLRRQELPGDVVVEDVQDALQARSRGGGAYGHGRFPCARPAWPTGPGRPSPDPASHGTSRRSSWPSRPRTSRSPHHRPCRTGRDGDERLLALGLRQVLGRPLRQPLEQTTAVQLPVLGAPGRPRLRRGRTRAACAARTALPEAVATAVPDTPAITATAIPPATSTFLVRSGPLPHPRPPSVRGPTSSVHSRISTPAGVQLNFRRTLEPP